MTQFYFAPSVNTSVKMSICFTCGTECD